MQLSIENCPVASRQINPPLPATAGSKQGCGKRQRGFTLIELMIILIIISIFVAIAMPAYSNYIKKARLAEAQVLFSGIKTELAVFYQEQARFPEQLEFDELELVTTGNDVMETRYNADPVNPIIEMVVAGFFEGENTIAWQWMPEMGPNMKAWWSCKSSENGYTTIQNKYLPKACKS
jgi:type IV pilus assembly protein PilA